MANKNCSGRAKKISAKTRKQMIMKSWGRIRPHFRCPWSACPKHFKEQAMVTVHVMKCHSGIMPVNCEWENCGQSYKTHELLERHERKYHYKNATHKCTKCEKACPSFEALKIHFLQTHTNWKKMASPEREIKDAESSTEKESTFSDPKTADSTDLIEENLSSMVAENANANTTDDLNNDKSIPSNVQSNVQSRTVASQPDSAPRMSQNISIVYECNICEKRFKSLHALDRHKTVQHMDKTSLTCTKCNEQFDSFEQLKEHFLFTHTNWKKDREETSDNKIQIEDPPAENENISMESGGIPIDTDVSNTTDSLSDKCINIGLPKVKILSNAILRFGDHVSGASLRDEPNKPESERLNVKAKLDEIFENFAKKSAVKDVAPNEKKITNQDNQSNGILQNKHIVVSLSNANEKVSDSKKITYYLVNTHSEESISNVKNSLLREALTAKPLPVVTNNALEIVDSPSTSASGFQNTGNMFGYMLSNIQRSTTNVPSNIETFKTPLTPVYNANLKTSVTNTSNAVNTPSVRGTAFAANKPSVKRPANAANKHSVKHTVNTGKKPRGIYKGPKYRPSARRTYGGPKSKQSLGGNKSDAANITFAKRDTCNDANARPAARLSNDKNVIPAMRSANDKIVIPTVKSSSDTNVKSSVRSPNNTNVIPAVGPTSNAANTKTANVVPLPNATIDLTDSNIEESNRLHDILATTSAWLENISLPVVRHTSLNININSMPFEKVTSNNNGRVKLNYKIMPDISNPAIITNKNISDTEDVACECKYCLRPTKVLMNGIAIHVCSECGLEFSSPSLLRDHFKTHTRVKLYVCKTCGKRFVGSMAFGRHVFTHNADIMICEEQTKNDPLNSNNGVTDKVNSEADITDHNVEMLDPLGGNVEMLDNCTQFDDHAVSSGDENSDSESSDEESLDGEASKDLVAEALDEACVDLEEENYDNNIPVDPFSEIKEYEHVPRPLVIKSEDIEENNISEELNIHDCLKYIPVKRTHQELIKPLNKQIENIENLEYSPAKRIKVEENIDNIGSVGQVLEENIVSIPLISKVSEELNCTNSVPVQTILVDNLIIPAHEQNQNIDEGISEYLPIKVINGDEYNLNNPIGSTVEDIENLLENKQSIITENTTFDMADLTNLDETLIDTECTVKKEENVTEAAPDTDIIDDKTSLALECLSPNRIPRIYLERLPEKYTIALNN